uniref:Uncharacterized protein n=1 Tax=Arundo donax TaxID=35708 RepID=A0A0A9GTU7_ARUDO
MLRNFHIICCYSATGCLQVYLLYPDGKVTTFYQLSDFFVPE